MWPKSLKNFGYQIARRPIFRPQIRGGPLFDRLELSCALALVGLNITHRRQVAVHVRDSHAAAAGWV